MRKHSKTGAVILVMAGSMGVMIALVLVVAIPIAVLGVALGVLH